MQHNYANYVSIVMQHNYANIYTTMVTTTMLTILNMVIVSIVMQHNYVNYAIVSRTRWGCLTMITMLTMI